MILVLAATTAAQPCGVQVTDDAAVQEWGERHSAASGGRVLWADDSEDVYYFDGTNVVLVQADDANDPSLASLENFVFGLGNGAGGRVIGAWRRGTDFAWVWTSDGGAPRLVKAANPLDPNQPLNPEALAIADGCVFMALQGFSGGQAVKHVFRVDPTTGDAANLTGNQPVPGLSGRIRSSGCRAAWAFEVDGGNVELHFYDGAVRRTIGSGVPSDLRDGILIWIDRDAANVQQIFLYDANLPAPVPTAITNRTDATRPILFAQTDGRHVAWIESDAATQNRKLMLLGGIELSDASTAPSNNPPNRDYPFQLNRGQILWTDQAGKTHYYDGRVRREVCGDGWLTDGFLAELLTPAGQADTEVFLWQGTAPAADLSAPLLVRASPGDGSATVAWDHILGATSYQVYVAEEPGVTPA
ncbi:MAG: hypothetical protein HRF43_13675, partial [Phycisphaerae bacterium]